MGSLAPLRDGRRSGRPGPVPVARLDAIAADVGLDDPGLVRAIADEMARRDSGDPALVGAVYERRLAADRDRRRAGGTYYTPAHLIDAAVERALGPVLDGRSPDEALELVVLDPACGAGAFLLAALERIAAHCHARGAGDRRARIVARCLRGIDVDPTAAAVCRLGLALAAGETADTGGVRVGDALAGDHRAEADVVLGNPPWGQKSFRFSRREAARLRKRYRTATGVLDPFKLFVERTHELLRDGGRWALVLPDIVLLKDQEPVRTLMLDGSELELIADAGRAFSGVNLDAALIVGRRTDAPARDHRVSIWHGVPPARVRSLPQRVFAELPGRKLNIHLTDRSLQLLRRLRRLPRLTDHFEIHEGVHTGNVRARLLVERPGPDRVPIVVGGREMARFRLAWGGRYLDRGVVLDRGAGEYANLGRAHWHERSKIVVRRTGDRIVAAYDGRRHWVSNNMFVVLPRRPMRADELRAWVAYLNGAFCTWYFRAVQPRTGRLFAELKIQHLGDFPIPPEGAWARVVPALARACRRAERGGAEISAGDSDEIVAAALELSPAQRRLVMGTRARSKHAELNPDTGL